MDRRHPRSAKIATQQSGLKGILQTTFLIRIRIFHDLQSNFYVYLLVLIKLTYVTMATRKEGIPPDEVEENQQEAISTFYLFIIAPYKIR